MSRPDPAAEIRITALRSVQGANYWSRRPVIRMDLTVGAYDEISSADVPDFTNRLLHALPGLVEHHCSVGERGGFVSRLRRGTYAPHIIEHVALELQVMIGHEVGYGQTRGGDVPGQYTLVFEHHQAGVGTRAATLALEVVCRALAGTLDTVDDALAELRLIAEMPDERPRERQVLASVTGGAWRGETRDALVRHGLEEDAVIDVAPAVILAAGLPYSRSELAIILDSAPTDVPERYRRGENARKLVSVVCDAVSRGGVVVARSSEPEIHAYARTRKCRVAVFSTEEHLATNATDVVASAVVVDNHILITMLGEIATDAGSIRRDTPAVAQVAAALAAGVLRTSGSALSTR